MGEGGGEGEGGQGGRLARLHLQDEHRQEGKVLGLQAPASLIDDFQPVLKTFSKKNKGFNQFKRVCLDFIDIILKRCCLRKEKIYLV